MEKIREYQTVTDFTTAGSGSASWCFAKRDGKEYFLKQFLSPVFPNRELCASDELYEKQRDECAEFFNRKDKLYKLIAGMDNGNIIWVKDFFCFNLRYFAVTDRVYKSPISSESIHGLSREDTHTITMVLLHCLALLHKRNIVHADLKPSNVLLKKTASNSFTVKLIDFDNSFIADEPPRRLSSICVDPLYMAPEMFFALIDEPTVLSTKMDIISLGLMLHKFWSGALPHYDAAYDYPFEAVLSGKDLVISDIVPEEYHSILRQCWKKSPDERPCIAEVYAVFAGKPLPEDGPPYKPTGGFAAAAAVSKASTANPFLEPPGDL